MTSPKQKAVLQYGQTLWELGGILSQLKHLRKNKYVIKVRSSTIDIDNTVTVLDYLRKEVKKNGYEAVL